MPPETAPPPGNKRLVLCCDGTWNRPDQISRGVRVPTHVTRIALAIAPVADEGTPQAMYYQRGVGTRQFQHLRGGAFGYGLSRNVRDSYRFIVESYVPGDHLYFFGFSRGAYTARSIVGLIRNCGILRVEHAGRVDEAYTLYRSRARRAGPDEIASEIFRRSYSYAADPPEIHFVGVWDTVGSVGIPIDGLRLPLIDRYWGFHDTKLSGYVRSAYQALALDEQRRPFKPTLWTFEDEEDAPSAERRAAQTLEQVWFAGVHCDVGGGYKEPELAEVPLLWMVSCAASQGLRFEAGHFDVRADVPVDDVRRRGQVVEPDALGPIHDSMTWLYRRLGRNLRVPLDEDGQSMASSAARREREIDYEQPRVADWVAKRRRQTTVRDGP